LGIGTKRVEHHRNNKQFSYFWRNEIAGNGKQSAEIEIETETEAEKEIATATGTETENKGPEAIAHGGRKWQNG